MSQGPKLTRENKGCLIAIGVFFVIISIVFGIWAGGLMSRFVFHVADEAGKIWKK